MHSFNNHLADKTRKIMLWIVYLKAIFRNILRIKTSAVVKNFLLHCIVLTIHLPIYCRKTLHCRKYTNAIVRNTLNTKKSATVKLFLQQCIVLTILLPITAKKHCFGECIQKPL